MKNSKRLEIIRENQSQYGTIQYISMKQYKRERIAGQLFMIGWAVFLIVPFFFDLNAGLLLLISMGWTLPIFLAIYMTLRPFVIYEKGICFSNSRISFLPFNKIIDAKTGTTRRWKTHYVMLNTIDGRSLCISKVTIKHMTNEVQLDIDPIIRLIDKGIQETRFEHRLKWDKLVLNIINENNFATMRARAKFKVVKYADANKIIHITLDVLARAVESNSKEFSKKYLYGDFPNYVKKVSSQLQENGYGYHNSPEIE